MKKPLVSTITVVRNGERLIERTIKSVINQTFADFEYIIIDGASTDGTVGIIKRYQKQISKWISEPDNSHFDAMNKGLKMAKGKYVWYVHAGDEIYDKNTLKKIFARNKAADAYYGETVLTNMNGDEVDTFRRRAPEQLSWKKMDKGMAVCHQSFLIKKELAEQYDYKSYPICADYDWIIKGLKKCNSAVNTHLILSKYLDGGISAKNKLKSWIEIYRLLGNHFGTTRNIINHFIIAATYLPRLFRKSPKQLRAEYDEFSSEEYEIRKNVDASLRNYFAHLPKRLIDRYVNHHLQGVEMGALLAKKLLPYIRNTNDRILDFGFGSGSTTLGLSRIFKKSILGVEIDPRLTKIANKWLSLSSLDNIDFITADIKSLNEKFSLIIANDVLEHVADPSDCLRMLSKRLNQNGRIYVLTTNRLCLYNFLRDNHYSLPFISILNKKHRNKIMAHILNRKVNDTQDYFFKWKLEKLFKDNGFEIVKDFRPYSWFLCAHEYLIKK